VLSLTFVGNATVLLRWGPFTLLTDPNFLHAGERAYLGLGLTSKRLREPALAIADLPPLDAVVLSHLHGDHWDRRARRGLDRAVPIVTTPHAARRLQGLHGFRRAVGLGNWEWHDLARDGSLLRVTSMPGMHAPGPLGRVLPPVMGSLLELDGRLVYLTGDTLMYDGVREVARRYPDIDVSVVHLGGTMLPGGLMVTMDGVQGADLLEVVRPRRAVPVHYEEYTVMKSPLSEFTAETDRRGMSDMVQVVGRGETVTLVEG
jgi:L-ascorbate metabolism protein UlaG (beta-lactamase superfamily)